MDENAAGIFVGVSAGGCLVSEGATLADYDADGLADWCEQALADSFAPELFYKYGDYVGREPYWAAQPAGYGSVIIAYLLSYYVDGGCLEFQCAVVPFHVAEGGHAGDSEDIYLTVYYNRDTHHWVLEKAAYSRHFDYGVYSKGSNEYPDLQYTSRQGGYPLVFVAQNKHANYKGLIECNHGGGGPFGIGALFDADTCEGNDTRVRVETHTPFVFPGNYTQWYNIGSRAVPFADCVPSRDVYSGNGRLECYWTDQRFRGWYPYSDQGDASSYSSKLAAMGFVGPPSPPPSPCGNWEVRPVYDGAGQETGSYENVWVPEECDTPPCTDGHWESRPILDGEGQETGSYEMVWVPDPGCV